MLNMVILHDEIEDKIHTKMFLYTIFSASEREGTFYKALILIYRSDAKMINVILRTIANLENMSFIAYF